MICLNCGATYSKTELYCPYCQSENKILAEQKHNIKLNKIAEEVEEIKKLPQKIVGRSTKVLRLVGSGIVVSIVIGMIAVFGWSKMSASRNYKVRQESLEQLEIYYKEQSYPEIREYLKANKLSESSYLKYKEISEAYYHYSMMCEELKLLEEYKEKGNTDRIMFSIQCSLRYGADAFITCKSGTKDNGILGNEDKLLELYEETAAKLVQELKLTSDEIESLSTKEDGDKEKIDQLALAVRERGE